MASPIKRRGALKALGSTGIVSLAGCLGGDDPGDDDTNDNTDGETTWEWAANPDDSAAYQWSAAVAGHLSEHSDQLSLNLNPTTGLADNMQRISDGEMDAGITSHAAYWNMVNGNDPFQETHDQGEIAMMATPSMATSQFFIAARADAEVEDFYDLDGRNYGFLHSGAATNPANRALFEGAGVEVIEEYSGFNDTRAAVTEGRVDAFQFFLSDSWIVPGPMQDIVQSVELEYIEVPEEAAQGVVDTFGFAYDNTTVPLEQVEALQDELDVDEVEIWQYANGGYVHPDIDEDLVYQFVETTLTNVEDMGDTHPAMLSYGFGEAPEETPLEERKGFAGIHPDMQFHPGAVQYYEDNDIELPN